MKLIVDVEVNDIGITCAFKGGRYYPYRENGTYRTANKAIQAALESHEHYGNSFTLVKTTDDEVNPAEPEKPVAPPVIEEPKADTTPEPEKPVVPTTTKDGTISVPDVSNSQEAKLYLNRNFEVPFSRLKNTEMIMKEAKVANLTFPNWKI